jgi:hypothetical protein
VSGTAAPARRPPPGSWPPCLPAACPRFRSMAGASPSPPDTETAGGMARRAALEAALLSLLGADGEEPPASALATALELLEIVQTPAAPVRRRLEERVWSLGGHLRPAGALGALADKLGFTYRDQPARPAAVADGG